jgi:hypothetical protein
MSKLPLAALISGLALSLAMPIAVRAATTDADQPQSVPSPKKERVQKPVTPLKRDVSNPKDADQPQGAPSPKKEKAQKPVTPLKRKVSDPKDADQPQSEPASKPKK